MRFVTVLVGGAERPGVLSADGKQVHTLDSLGFSQNSMLELIEDFTPQLGARLQQILSENPEEGIPVETAMLQAPIPQPAHDLICVGLNYVEHARESARFKGEELVLPQYPVYFSKRVYRAVAPGGSIPAHIDITQKLDYESELAVIIGKVCDHVEPGAVYDHIFGYTIVNDISAREIQSNHAQFYFGKSLDGFTPMGPWIVTADELPAPPHLNVCSRVNGELRQNSNTKDFIFDIPHLISQLSRGITLQPGDILITGTPSGVGMGFTPPRFLKAGDVVECEIEGLGVLRNTIV